MNEEWRPAPGFEGYEVSDRGRLRSTKLGETPRILSLLVRPQDGYLQATLRPTPGVRKTGYIHVLVAGAFIGPRPEGLVIRHLDGDQTNNVPANLAYGTRSENNLDTVRHGRHPETRRTHCDHGHEFTPENTAFYRNGRTGARRRRCKTCRRAQATGSAA